MKGEQCKIYVKAAEGIRVCGSVHVRDKKVNFREQQGQIQPVKHEELKPGWSLADYSTVALDRR